jgi:Zn-dependent protease
VSGSAVQGGRRLQLRILGFPVHIDLSFPLIMGLLGFNLIGSVGDLVIWLVVATLSVFVHELGHALVARTTGARPEIALTGFGGLTTYSPPGPVSRGRSLAISLAGPLVGLVIGLALAAGYYSFRGDLYWDSWQLLALRYGMWTCIGWSVLNLLPVLPLDGGQAMRELLPGAPPVRARRAAGVSVITAAVVAVLAYLWGQPFVALFFLFFGLTNVLAMRRPAADGDAAGPRATPEQAVVGMLWQGAAVQARQTMESLPEGTPIDLAVHGAVMAATGEPAQGFALLHQELARRPDDANVAALLVLARALVHDWPGLDADLRGRAGAVVPRSVVERAAQEAQTAGRPDVAQWLLDPQAPRA